LHELNAENDMPLPTPQDIWNPVDMAPHIPSQGAPIILSLPATNHPGQEHNAVLPPPLKYPVLNTVMPFLETHISPQLVYHLLELYFTGTFPNHLHAIYRHLPCYILRTHSFLTENLRPTSPALLTSMLWMAAMDDRAFSLSISSSQQRNVCQFLSNLTRTLLQVSDNVSPNIQEPPPVGLNSSSSADHRLMESAGHLDRVITYIHIASIVFTEQDTAGTRWYVKFCPSHIACFLIFT